MNLNLLKHRRWFARVARKWGHTLAVSLFALSVCGSGAEAGDVTLKLPPTLGYFSHDPGGNEDSIAVGFGPLAADGGQPGEWFMLGKAPSGTRPTRLRWATTRTCPAARGLMNSLNELPMPRISMPMSEEAEVRPGQAVYILETRAEFSGGGRGEIRLVAGTETPLARWISDAFQRLDQCWDDRGPFDTTPDSSPDD